MILNVICKDKICQVKPHRPLKSVIHILQSGLDKLRVLRRDRFFGRAHFALKKEKPVDLQISSQENKTMKKLK